MGDMTRACRLCGTEFTFTEGEQAFYLERGYRPPEYCPACRDARRATQTERQLRPTTARRSGFSVVCSSCGRTTTVPFHPDPARPVLCGDCFAERKRQRAV